ncbi:hypothetical protein ACOMHN_029100 [Nucella lapillus]
MAILRRLKIVMALGTVALLVILVIQQYFMSSQTSPHINKDIVANKEQKRQNIHQIRPTLAKNESAGGKNETNVQPKIILARGFPGHYNLKRGSTLFSGCDHPCMMTFDYGQVEKVDCVMIFSHTYKSRLPKRRPAHQMWVFFAVESPSYVRNRLFQRPEWRSMFNWTLTYRRDSDFYFGYGDVVKPRSPLPKRDLAPVVAGKSKLVAWFVSNCKTHSKREDFVKVLKNFMPVDVYGRCGTLKCTRIGDQDPQCLRMLNSDYYFYLSFENSYCTDYVTEKLYRMIKYIDIVPVVRGGANYTRLLPKHSYVDASQFPSIKALADHLKHVASNKTLYHSYLAWKNDWQVIEPSLLDFCQLCERLHRIDRWARVYPDIDQWWAGSHCWGPPKVVET